MKDAKVRIKQKKTESRGAGIQNNIASKTGIKIQKMSYFKNRKIKLKKERQFTDR